MSPPEMKPAPALDLTLADLHDPADAGSSLSAAADTGLLRQKAAPSPTIRAARTVVIAGAATFGIFTLATAGFLGASKLLPTAKRGEIQVGRMDLPDLKDGVPQISSGAPPLRTIAGPSVVPAGPAKTAVAAPPQVAPQPAPQPSPLTAALATPAMGGGSSTGTAAGPVAAPSTASGKLPIVLLSPKPVGAPQPLAPPRPAAPAVTAALSEPSPMPPARVLPVVRTTGSLEPAPALRPSPALEHALAAPLPPAPPTRTASVAVKPADIRPVEAKPAPQPSRVAVAPRAKPARHDPSVADPTTTATIAPRRVAVEYDSYDLFGLKVPSIGTTANRLKEGVDAIGNAIKLPGQ